MKFARYSRVMYKNLVPQKDLRLGKKAKIFQFFY